MNGDYDGAVADFTEAIRINPRDARAYWLHRRTWSLKNEDDIAFADLNDAILVDPEFAGVFSARGESWLKKNDHDKAIADFNRAIELGPNTGPTTANAATPGRGGASLISLSPTTRKPSDLIPRCDRLSVAS